MKMILKSAVAAIALATASYGVAAADGGNSPWQVRLRAIAVMPSEHAHITPIGGSVKVDNSVVPEADISYFFNDHWALELIAATTRHSVQHTPSGLKLGSAWLLPPTLTAQYHFAPDAKIRPYAGIGVNYTIFYSINQPAAPLHIGYQNRFGWALQAGADIPFGENGYFFNIDVKKIFLSTKAVITPGPIVANVDLNPWVVGIGVGTKL